MSIELYHVSRISMNELGMILLNVIESGVGRSAVCGRSSDRETFVDERERSRVKGV